MTEKIDLNDFVTAVNIIDICTERGAFKGNELLIVGQLREKFSTFVKDNAQQKEENGIETFTEDEQHKKSEGE